MIESQDQFQTLLAQVSGGDAEAAETFARAYEPLVRRAIRARLHRSDLRRVFDSMDFCQSVFGSFFKLATTGATDLDSPDQLARLLIVITRRKLANAMRNEYRRKEHKVVEREVFVGRSLIDPSPTPSTQATARELTERIREQLSPDERRLADLRSAGKTWDEIAHIVGGSAQACRVRLLRTIQRILDNFGIHGHDN